MKTKIKNKNKKKYEWQNKKPYQVNWLKARRNEWLKANGPCKKCGTWDNLQVDHIDPMLKEYDAGKIWSRTKEFREKELAKCQVLCKSCHFKKTTEENKKFGHGTPAKYSTCSCAVCKAAKKSQKRN